MKTALLACVLVLAAPRLNAAGPVIKVDFSDPGLTPSHWVLTIHPDGTGHFLSDGESLDSDGQSGIEPANVDRDVQLTPRFAKRVFETARHRNLFNSACDSHLKVAFQGWKTLSYSGPEGEGSCGFNYSKDKEIQELGDTLVAVANTVIEGARLENLLHHDPLGLDKETEYLVAAAGDGRAQQLCAIRGVLQHLADDENVLDRVRKRARWLLMSMEK